MDEYKKILNILGVSDDYPKGYLKNIGWEVYNLLEGFIEVQNKTLSIFNIFRRSNFFYRQRMMLIILHTKLEKCKNDLIVISQDNNLGHNEKQYVCCFLEYINYLNSTVKLLGEWANMMGDSRNPEKKYFKEHEIKQVFNLYQKNNSKYSELGYKLKNLFEQL